MTPSGKLLARTMASYVDPRMPGPVIELGPGTGAAPVGRSIFQSYVLPFEIVSLLLLAALIGSIVLSRRDEEND